MRRTLPLVPTGRADALARIALAMMAACLAAAPAQAQQAWPPPAVSPPDVSSPNGLPMDDLPPHERVRGGMFDASDPQAIATFMVDNGYRAQLQRAEDGMPEIAGRLSRTDYRIRFYECEQAAACNSIQFVAEAAAPYASTLARVNEFNLRWRYVRATLAGDVLRLQQDVNLDAGVTADNLLDTLDIWRQLLEIFERDLLAPR